MNTYYITTAIDYVNAAPHLGHAYEKIATDVMARFQRLMGKTVFFLTGTDEHGTKVAETAAKNDLQPKAYADQTAEKFKEAWAFLNISYNRFIRTTDPQHYALVAEIWQRLLAKGDIYKASYTGKYCAGCESFLTERDLDDSGLCKIHRVQPEPVEEENYFFKLSAYKEPLRDLIDNHGLVQPRFRAEEVLNILDDLPDISVSRPKHSVSWGIPVPGNPEQTIYVWIDALSNYITGIDCFKDDAQFEKFWPADCHVIGKDILRFHALYWPAILLSAGLPAPKSIFAHGFINLNDNKISKSLGNVVSPKDLADRFHLMNPDPIRYYLMVCTSFGQDGNFTEQDFIDRVNSDLANNLGNLVNRTLNMTVKYFDGVVPTVSGISENNLYGTDDAYFEALASAHEQLPEGAKERDAWKDGYSFRNPNHSRQFLTASLRNDAHYLPTPSFDNHYDDIAFKYNAFDFEFAAYTLFTQVVNPANLFINDIQPWNLHKEGNTEALAKVIYSILERIRQAAVMLYPITPTISQTIFEQLGYTVSTIDHELEVNGQRLSWESLWTPLPYGQAINLQGPILPRLEDDLADAEAKKAGKKAVKA